MAGLGYFFETYYLLMDCGLARVHTRSYWWRKSGAAKSIETTLQPPKEYTLALNEATYSRLSDSTHPRNMALA